MSQLILRSTAVWIGLFILAFINGALREVLMKSVLGIQEPLAHRLSCITGALLWTALTWLLWQKMKITSYPEAVLVGIYWFILTVLTETLFINRFLSKLSWNQILQTYNVTQGEFWGLVLIYVGLLPLLIFKIKQP